MGRTTLKLSTKGLEELITKFDQLGGDIKKVTEEALEEAGKKIGNDTLDALAPANLPAGGKYSTGETKNSVVQNPKVEWSGSVAEIGVGFDYGKPGAGGFLITGTPRMRPDDALNKMYKQKRYMTQIEKEMKEVFNEAIIKRMEG